MMQIRVSGKQVEIGEALPQHVRERLAAAVEKHFNGQAEGNVVFAHEGSGYRADCTVHLSTGQVLASQGSGPGTHEAFDAALQHLEKQVRRYMRRLKNHHGKPKGA